MCNVSLVRHKGKQLFIYCFLAQNHFPSCMWHCIEYIKSTACSPSLNTYINALLSNVIGTFHRSTQDLCFLLFREQCLFSFLLLPWIMKSGIELLFLSCIGRVFVYIYLNLVAVLVHDHPESSSFQNCFFLFQLCIEIDFIKRILFQ